MDYTSYKELLILELQHEFSDKYIIIPENVSAPGHKERAMMSEALQDAIKIVQDFKPYPSNYQH